MIDTSVVSIVPHEKSDELARRDKYFGGIGALFITVSVVVAILLGMRRLRRRVDEERAERAIADEFRELESKTGDVGVLSARRLERSHEER